MAGAGVITNVITTPDATRVLSVFASGIDVTGDVLWSSVSVTDSGTNAKGTASFRIERTPTAVAEITDQSQVRVYDHGASGGEVFRGYIRARRPSEEPTYAYLDIIADDLTSILDDSVIDVEWRPPETLQARLGFLWGKYAGNHLSGDFQYVLSVGGTLPAQRFALVSLRNAIEMVIAQASSTADYYVDMLGKLHVFTTETNNAPKNIDADAPDGTEIAPEQLDLEYDSNAYANRVYISGASPTASGYFPDQTAIAAANGLVRTAVVQAPDCTTAAMAQSLASMYLARVKTAKPRGSFTTTSAKTDGWRAGQNVLVTSAAHGLSAQSYRIARVTTRVIRPGAGLQRRYDVEFGGAKAGSGIDGVAPLIAGSTAGIYMLDQLGNSIVSNAASSTLGSIGPTVRRYIMSGVYNGDFYAPPPGPDAPVDNSTNPLPNWSFSQSSGTAVTVTQELDPTTASGRRLRFSMAAGAASDQGDLEQVIPVNGTSGQSFVYIVHGLFKTAAATNLIEVRVFAEYLKADGVTTTGTPSALAATTNAIGASSLWDGFAWANEGLVPADAYFLKIRLSMRRGAAANGDTCTAYLMESRVVAGSSDVVAGETTTPASYGFAQFYQTNGILTIRSNKNGVSGTQPTLLLEGGTAAGTPGNINTGVFRLKHYPMGAIATRTTTQSITTATHTPIQFNATDISDPFLFHDPASNNTRITVPTGWAGTYLAVGNATFASNATGIRLMSVTVNGAAPASGTKGMMVPASASAWQSMSAVVPLELAVGDYVEFQVWQNSGGNINVEANATGALYYIGETL